MVGTLVGKQSSNLSHWDTVRETFHPIVPAGQLIRETYPCRATHLPPIDLKTIYVRTQSQINSSKLVSLKILFNSKINLIEFLIVKSSPKYDIFI